MGLRRFKTSKISKGTNNRKKLESNRFELAQNLRRSQTVCAIRLFMNIHETFDIFCRCIRPLRANSESAVAVFCFLSLIASKADSRSIAELLSEMELADSDYDIHPRKQHQQQVQTQQQQLFVGDDGYDDVTAVTKRSPWAQYEVNVDNLRQKIIRSKAFSNRQKHSSFPLPLPPTEKFLDTPSSLVGELAMSSSPEDAYVDGYAMGWAKARAYLEEAGKKWPEVEGLGEDGDSAPYQYGDGHRYARSSRAWDPATGGHPVYLGMGQESANAALSTFASLLAEEEKRKNSEHPVRFIGKRRFATDE